MATPVDRLFFFFAASTALAVVVAGFSRTYYLGFWFDAPELEVLVHVHALAFTAWLLMLLSQTVLIRVGRSRWHRVMGKVAIPVVAVMVITGYMVIFGKERPTPGSRAFIFTPMVSLVLFPAMFAAAIHFRRDPATHKRLMLLATVAISTAGVSRFMRLIGLEALGYYGGYALTYALLLLPLIAFDLTRLGRLHRATAWGTAALIARHPLHIAIAYTDQWQRIAAWLTPPV